MEEVSSSTRTLVPVLTLTLNPNWIEDQQDVEESEEARHMTLPITHTQLLAIPQIYFFFFFLLELSTYFVGKFNPTPLLVLQMF